MQKQPSIKKSIFNISKKSINITSNISYTNNFDFSVKSNENISHDSNCFAFNSEVNCDSSMKNSNSKSGFWDREETINLYTCYVLHKKFEMKWNCLHRFLKGRNKIQIFNKVKNLKNKLTNFLAYFVVYTDADLFMKLNFVKIISDEVFGDLRNLVLDLFQKYIQDTVMQNQRKFQQLSSKHNMQCVKEKLNNNNNNNNNNLNLNSNFVLKKNNKNNFNFDFNAFENKNNFEIFENKNNLPQKQIVNENIQNVKCPAVDLNDYATIRSLVNGNDFACSFEPFGFGSPKAQETSNNMRNEDTKAKSNNAIFNFSDHCNSNKQINNLKNDLGNLKCEKVETEQVNNFEAFSSDKNNFNSILNFEKNAGLDLTKQKRLRNSKNESQKEEQEEDFNFLFAKEQSLMKNSNSKKINNPKNLNDKINNSNKLNKNIFNFRKKPKNKPAKRNSSSIPEKPLLDLGIENRHILNYNFSISEKDFHNALKTNCKVNLTSDEQIFKETSGEALLEKEEKTIENYLNERNYKEFLTKNNNLIVSFEDLNLFEKISELEYKNTNISFLNDFNEVCEIPKQSDDIIIDELILSRFLVEKINEIMENN